MVRYDRTIFFWKKLEAKVRILSARVVTLIRTNADFGDQKHW